MIWTIFSVVHLTEPEHLRSDSFIAFFECSYRKRSLHLLPMPWVGATLSSDLVADKEELKRTVERGLAEMRALLTGLGVR